MDPTGKQLYVGILWSRSTRGILANPKLLQFLEPKDDRNTTFHVEFAKNGGTNVAYIGLSTLLELQLTERQGIADVKATPLPTSTICRFESNIHDASNDVFNISVGRVALRAVLEAYANNLDNKENKEMKHSAVGTFTFPRMRKISFIASRICWV
jgi:hypothetical protein